MSQLFQPHPEGEERREIVFYEALRHPPAGREAFLEAECGGDARLRAEVEAMLRDHAEAGTFLSADGPLPPEIEAELIRGQREEEGGMIGPYKLRQQIGEGGFGTVWMAEQEKPVRRRVALKIIKLGMDTKDVVARFEQERQALAMMDHPNIAKVLDAGATPLGRPFFVMELVRGIKITEYCAQANMPVAERLKLFVQVCHAVQHAHQKGIIHRDLKPSNILVTLHDGTPVPKVIDFGVAKATGSQRLAEQTVFTRFEQMIGTPAYMSPEQAEMSGLDIDTRSDIYALGVLLYELLTGTTPFDAKELLSAGLDAMRRTIRETDPPKPSTRLSQSLTAPAISRPESHSVQRPPSSAIDPDLDWIVMKALEKDRTRRYESASGLAADIQRHLNDEPVSARPPGTMYRFRKMVRRNQLAVGAAAAVLAALVAGLAISTWMFFKERDARERAVVAEREQSRLRQHAEAQEAKATTEAGKSQQVARFLQDMLKSVGPSVALGRDTKLLREILDKTAARVGDDLKDQPEVEAELRNALGGVYMELADIEEAGKMHRLALALRRSVFGDEHPAVAESLHATAFTLADVKDEEKMHREALAMRSKLLGNEHADVARSMNAVAYSIRHQGRFAEAETMAKEALAMARKLLGKDDPEIAKILFVLAQCAGHQKRFTESGVYHTEALEILRKAYGNKHPLVARSLLNLSQNLRMEDRLEEAEAMNREALHMHRELLGEKHPDSMGSLGELASVLREAGKLDELEALHRENLAMQRTLLGNDSSMVSHSLHGLAHLLEERGKLAEAESLFREGLDVYDRLLESGDLTGLGGLKCLAALLQRTDRLAEAEPLFRERLERRRKLLGKEHEIVGLTLHSYAWLLHNLNRREEAAALRSEALEILHKTYSDDRHAMERVLDVWAELLYRDHHYTEAEPYYRWVIVSREADYGATGSMTLVSKASLARLLADWAWTERHKSPEPENKQPEHYKPRERAAEAERLLRYCLSEWESTESSSKPWRMADCRSRLGAALVAVVVTDPDLPAEVRQARLIEAESLLQEGCEGLRLANKDETKYYRDALLRLVRLYEAWGKSELAVAWRGKVARWDREKPTEVAPPADHTDE